jgi:hypothetical protein
MNRNSLLRWVITLALVVSVAGLSGCDSSDPNGGPSPMLTGSWNGTSTVQGLSFNVSLQLVENNGAVNGNGTITLQNTVAVSATGTYNFPAVSMTIRSSGFEDLNFSGTLSADGNSISGTMMGSGFDNFGLTLRRQ